ncbi:MAG: dephospho-CoA kinase [Verrucomicrobiota bacterium]
MFLLGITGGIGTGKSTTFRVFSEWQLPCLDTDQIAREQSAVGSEGLREIVEAFGNEILNPQGELRRDALSRIVFGDPGALRVLEGILHPRISKVWRSRIAEWDCSGVRTAAVIIPLLFEKGYDVDFDRVVCLACTRRTQYRRLRDRSWSDQEIQARERAQMPVEEKMARANYVIWTEGALHLHRAQWSSVLRENAPATCCPA